MEQAFLALTADRDAVAAPMPEVSEA
jgi:hypothetical protein